jgi:hypothetical protein
MKKIFFALFLLSSTAIFAQNNQYRNRRYQPPQPIQQSFQRDYPNVNDATWQRDNNGQWHAIYREQERYSTGS